MIDAGIARKSFERIEVTSVDVFNMPRELLGMLESLGAVPGVEVLQLRGPRPDSWWQIDITPVVPVITEVEAVPFYRQHAHDSQAAWDAQVRQGRTHR